jgi:hypothetical protein
VKLTSNRSHYFPLTRASIFLAAALLAGGLPATGRMVEPRTSEPEAPGRLQPCGRALCRDDGSRFRWRGVTAFGLLDLVADGRLEDARRFISWAERTGFTVVRVLAMLPDAWLDLSADEGRRALPRLFALTAAEGLHVQVVALANTEGRDQAFLDTQVREVGRLCAAADNCVLEIANEPYHGSQAGLESAATMRRLEAEVPASVPVAWGAARQDTSDSMAGGSYIVAHLSRSGQRWDRVARLRELERLSRQTGKFVVDNEPIGAAEVSEPQRRDDAPAAFFGQGALSRILELGSTFHCDDCLYARVPGPVQQEAALAFIAGATLVPEGLVLDAPGPIDTARASGGGAAFAAANGDRGWLVLLGGADPAELHWPGGWRSDMRVADREGVSVWTIARGTR